MLIDGVPYAGHMGVSAHWMIHYLNAGMTESATKRAEEEAFMNGFDTGFARRHANALRSIAERFGLDYLVIDCAEAVDGELLVFEVDPSAVVHPMDPDNMFPYKLPAHAKSVRCVSRDAGAQGRLSRAFLTSASAFFNVPPLHAVHNSPPCASGAVLGASTRAERSPASIAARTFALSLSAHAVYSGDAMSTFERITQNPAQMGGTACIRNMRVTVGMIVGLIGSGRSIDETLADYPYLERDDILQALRYAAWLAEERELVLAPAWN